MLDSTKHKINLSNLLVALYKNPILATSLGFKGGTACMFFYDLPRVSVDLDFDLVYPLASSEIDIIAGINKTIDDFRGDYEIRKFFDRNNTLFWRLSYGDGERNIKIEISKRQFPNSYEQKNLYGVPINVLKIGDIIAHKLVAIKDRSSVANRDLFDSWFFLKGTYLTSINHEIIRFRTNLYPHDFYSDLYEFINEYSPDSMLEGLGDMLDSKVKSFVKSGKMKDELSFLLSRQISFFPAAVKLIDRELSHKTRGDYALYSYSFLVDDAECTVSVHISRTVLSILGLNDRENDATFAQILDDKITELLYMTPKENTKTVKISSYSFADKPMKIESLKNLKLF